MEFEHCVQKDNRPSTAAVALIHATLDMVGADAQALSVAPNVFFATCQCCRQVRYKKQFDKLIHYIDERYLVFCLSLAWRRNGSC